MVPTTRLGASAATSSERDTEKGRPGETAAKILFLSLAPRHRAILGISRTRLRTAVETGLAGWAGSQEIPARGLRKFCRDSNELLQSETSLNSFDPGPDL
jgi:hypothetical protein